MLMANLAHCDIKEWLQRLDMTEYEEHFTKYSGVEELINFNDNDIRELGINNAIHRERIADSLKGIKGELKSFVKVQRARKI